MCMGALGHRGHTKHKNKTDRGINGVPDQDLGAMAGEISPDIMFWGV